MNKENITLTVRYHPDTVYRDWLTEAQQVGIDEAATTERFFETLRKAIGNWGHVGAIQFVADETMFNFAVEGDELNRRMNEDMIEDTFINLPWLTYESAEAHAKALTNAVNGSIANHAITLMTRLKDYGVSTKEAKALVAKYKDRDRWEQTTFVLGGRHRRS